MKKGIKLYWTYIGIVVGIIAPILTYISYSTSKILQSLMFIPNYFAYIILAKLFPNPVDTSITTAIKGISVFFLFNIIQYTLIGYLIDLKLAKKKNHE